jgi:hypothetical protein
MIVRALLPLIVSAAIAAASGCCNPYVYRGGCGPCGPAGGGPCEEVVTCRLPAPCVDTCGKGPVCEDDCGPPCGDCGYGYGCGWYPGKHLVEWLTCGSGCGGVYVNEWCSDPPDCCDPCSPCGGYTGGVYCVPLHVKFWRAILGEPCCEPFLPTLDFVPGCGSPGCGGDCGGDCGGEYVEGMPVMPGKGGEPTMPHPRIVPGSPADMGPEAIPVPEPAPTRAISGKTAHGHMKRQMYYPYGRIRSR